jgi:hypothetical protein
VIVAVLDADGVQGERYLASRQLPIARARVITDGLIRERAKGPMVRLIQERSGLDADRRRHTSAGGAYVPSKEKYENAQTELKVCSRCSWLGRAMATTVYQ